jgi:hypothetical protein
MDAPSLKLPRRWTEVGAVRIPDEHRWGEFWLRLGPFVHCAATCLRRLERRIERAGARGVYIEPAPTAVVSMVRTRTHQSDFKEFVWIGACQVCGTVHWARDSQQPDQRGG